MHSFFVNFEGEKDIKMISDLFEQRLSQQF